jgi:uncharacterized protein YigE (DUF2233 family)
MIGQLLGQIVRRALVICCAACALIAAADSARAACRNDVIENIRYVICEFNADDALELFLRDANGAVLGQFDRVRETLAKRGRAMSFAMNAGMYHEDRSPVGLYVEHGQELKRISTADGPGNFSLKPNGVLYVTKKGAGVLDTQTYLRRKIHPLFATQSGPMLVIDGKLHPRFAANSTSRYRRNGVGSDGRRIVFALADEPVTLHQFARVFRDVLKTPNALYLDGSICRLYAADLKRNDFGMTLGPIVAVSVPAKK